MTQIIALTQGKYAKVSDKDYERINKYLWCYHKNGRACRTVNKKTIWMHHAVLELSPEDMPSEYEVDHRDRDPLNNQDWNLRVVTHAVNMQNSKTVVRAKARVAKEVQELISLSAALAP